MAKGLSTRQTIVDEALRLTVTLGVESVTIGMLAGALGLSKSGLFAHFKSKDGLQRAVLDEAIGRFAAQVVRPALDETQPRPRLRRLMEGYLDWIEGRGVLPGCPFLTLIQDYDDRPGALRDTLVASQTSWRTLLTDTIRVAISEGELGLDTDAGQLVFELIGAALAFQHAHKLLADPDARRRAETAIDRLLSSPAKTLATRCARGDVG